MDNYICFIPNFGLAKQNDGLFTLPKSDQIMLERIADDEGINIIVLAQELSFEDAFLDAQINRSDIVIKAFGRPHDKQGFFGKSINYIWSIFHIYKILLNLSSNTLVYIYFPGNISIISSILCILLNKKYGLYVRCEWGRRWLYRIFAHVIFKNAEWILATGVGFCRTIESCNDKVSPVSPMIAFHKDVRFKTDYSFAGSVELLFVGHLRKTKGVYDVIEAVRLLQGKKYMVNLTIVGGGEDAEVSKLNRLVSEYDLIDRVSYMGHVSDPETLQNCFRKADMFIYPSYFTEGFPRVIYEAMLYALPICCTIQEGMEGFMEDNINCRKVNSREPSQLASIIEVLISDENLRKNLGKAAYRDINNYLSKFSGMDHAGQVIERYKNRWNN